MLKIADDLPDQDALQTYSDFLGFRLEEAKRQIRDIPNSEAYDSWQAAGFPGFKSSAVNPTRASQASLGDG